MVGPKFGLCSGTNYFNMTASSDAYTDSVTYGDGAGSGAYWFGGGPGVDPSSNWSTVSEAKTWGADQAMKAITMANAYTLNSSVLWIDVEQGAGWRNRYSSCGVISGTVSPALARDVFDGFWNYLEQHTTGYSPGAYSSHSFWDDPGGSNSLGSLGSTMQWTSNWAANNNACANPGPSDWTQSFSPSCNGYTQYSAAFFGGIASSSSCAVVWQWSGGTQDYDQFDMNREYSCV
jgi:hypothetical protein